MRTDTQDDALGDAIPALAQRATRRAFEAAIRGGRLVRICRDDIILGLLPVGSERVVGSAPPSFTVQPGLTRRLPQDERVLSERVILSPAKDPDADASRCRVRRSGPRGRVETLHVRSG